MQACTSHTFTDIGEKMFLNKINITILLSLLWMLVKAGVDDDLSAALNERMKYANPSNEDEMEFNEQWDLLDAAKNDADEKKKESALTNFQIYKDRRDAFIKEINALLQLATTAGRRSIARALRDALNGRNNLKEFVKDWALAQLATLDGSNGAPNNGSTNSSTALNSLPGGIILITPTFLNEIYGSGQLENNNNKQIGKILEKLLKKWELFENNLDDDWFNLFSWR